MLRTFRVAVLLVVLSPIAALAQTSATATQSEPATPTPGAPGTLATPGAAAVPATAGVAGASVPYDRFHEFIHNTIKSPAFHVEAFGAALIDQAGHFPKEWDTEDNAFLKRNAGRFGQAFVAGVIEAGAAEAVHYHVGYERCDCSGGFKRLGHVVVHTFVVRHVDGHIVLNTPFLASRYASAALAKAWYPDSYTGKDVVIQGTASLGTAVGLNLLDEFGPDILHALHLK
jgi:hypothetical protein